MFQKFLVNYDPGKLVSLRWMRKIEGVIRVAVFDSNSDKAFVVAYLEQNNQYSVFSLNCNTGELYWTKDVVQGGYGSPAVLHEILVCPTKFTDIIALCKETGVKQWDFCTSHRVRSSISAVEEKIYFSSGSTIFELDNKGLLLNSWSYEGVFFYGPVDVRDELIISLGTIEDERGESNTTIFAFHKSGSLIYQTSISVGPVISSDTCGIAWQDNRGFVGSNNIITCFDANTGDVIWTSQVNGHVGRHICTIAHGRIYYVTLNGVAGSLNCSDGLHQWEIKTADPVIVSPISVLNSNLALVADGYLSVLRAENGQLLQQVPVGHSPYSMLSLNGKCALLGAGEPPHNGLLFGFDVEDTVDERYACQVQHTNGFLENRTHDILIHVSNVDHEILDMQLDGSIFQVSNVSGEKITPFSFTFRLPIPQSVCSGNYVIPVVLHLMSGELIRRPILLSFTRREPLPRKARINIPEIKQEQPTYSGAAIACAVKNLYEGRNIDQSIFREMIDASRILSGYEPHDTWRIILRRVLTSSASTKEELPEFNAV